MKTAVWHGDRHIDLQIPSDWDVKVLWPATPPPLTAAEMASILEHPVGQASLTEMCRGKSRPLIIVDDMNRPTPASQIIPFLLKSICAADIPLGDITILMATGTHGKPGPDAFLKKVGIEASSCRLLIHDCFSHVRKIGVTTYGTPVFVNKAVIASDVVIGVGGVYPNHTAGFGGGSKLVLGVLGIRTIYHLHFRHKPLTWGNTQADSFFRRELDEIAKMIGMEMNVSAIIDADRNIIKMYCGDQQKYFPEAVSFYEETFCTSASGDADVVVSNTYPNDLSLTFARMKGFVPLNTCRRDVSRIAIASCNEGLGLHNIWPFVNVPRLHRLKHILRLLSVMPLRDIMDKFRRVLKRTVISRTRWFLSPTRETDDNAPLHPIWLFRTGNQDVAIPSYVPGIHITSEWSEIIDAVCREHAGRHNLRVVVYPCAFLQVPREPSGVHILTKKHEGEPETQEPA